jgi:hypothetical protein
MGRRDRVALFRDWLGDNLMGLGHRVGGEKINDLINDIF